MEWAVVAAILIGLVVIFSARRKRPSEAEQRQRVEADIAARRQSQDALKTGRASSWLPLVDRMPILDVDRSPYLHTPIYDCASDLFELPCAHSNFGLHFSSSHGAFRLGFLTSAEVREILTNFTTWPGPVACVDAGAVMYLVWTDYPREPGGKVYQFTRTGKDDFYCWGWRSGMSPGARDADPPFMVTEIEADPARWSRRMDALRSKWQSSSSYRSACRMCTHSQAPE